jgi:hypothetical protein
MHTLGKFSISIFILLLLLLLFPLLLLASVLQQPARRSVGYYLADAMNLSWGVNMASAPGGRRAACGEPHEGIGEANHAAPAGRFLLIGLPFRCRCGSGRDSDAVCQRLARQYMHKSWKSRPFSCEQITYGDLGKVRLGRCLPPRMHAAASPGSAEAEEMQRSGSGPVSRPRLLGSSGWRSTCFPCATYRVGSMHPRAEHAIWI